MGVFQYETSFVGGQRTTLMRLQALQTQALYELGLGLLAVGLACLVGLGLAMRSQWEVA